MPESLLCRAKSRSLKKRENVGISSLISIAGSHRVRPCASKRARRGVAQLGRALVLGTRCRRFESCLPDHLNPLFYKGFFVSRGSFQKVALRPNSGHFRSFPVISGHL